MPASSGSLTAVPCHRAFAYILSSLLGRVNGTMATVPPNSLTRKARHPRESSFQLRGQQGAGSVCVVLRRVRKALSEVSCLSLPLFSSDPETTWHPLAPVCLDTVVYF